jgi:tRNA threonylcarbamoyladenosine biosynthesis protein TsaB
MALILNIDTAQEVAGIYLARNGMVISDAFNERSMDHSTWVHEAIRGLMQKAKCGLNELEAVAVAGGPGSYTGLRIGMATAKGLCYALRIPFIKVSTLKMMAAAAGQLPGHFDLVCPMIDARRQEVFMAVYRRDLMEVCPPRTYILESEFFVNLLNQNRILFCGSGTVKWSKVCDHPNALFFTDRLNTGIFASLSYEYFQQKTFYDLSYAEPDYLKDFYTYPRLDHRNL